MQSYRRPPFVLAIAVSNWRHPRAKGEKFYDPFLFLYLASLDGTELLGAPFKVRRNMDKSVHSKGAKRGPPVSRTIEDAGAGAGAESVDPAAALAKRVKKKQKKHNKRERARRTQAAMQADPALAKSVQGLIKERQTARDAKDWGAADAIREKLKQKGVRVTDTPSGTVWHVID